MNKQTAVEWLVNQVEDYIGLIPVDIIEQAKAMEENQIINTFKDAQVFKIMNDETRAEQYYNETYNSL